MHKKSHEDLIKTFDDPSRDEWQRPEVVLKLMGEMKGKKVIDIGTGSGYFAKYFFNSGADLVAADVDQKFLDHVKKVLPKVKTALIQFDDPLMDQSSYDIAFTSNTYHHIDKRVPYLQKVLKGLKSGGKFVVVDFNLKSENGPPKELRVDVSVTTKEYLEAGFSEVHIYQDKLPKQYIVIGIKR